MTYFKVKGLKPKLNNLNNTFKRNFLGFGVLEVVIAMAIISITSLGISQLNVAMLRAQTDAVNRRTALMLANDMAERIRSNPSNAGLDGGLSSHYVTGGNGTYNTNCIGTGGFTCWADQLARQDLWEWKQYMTAMMPPGSTGVITATAGTDGFMPTFTIKVNWTDIKGATQTVTTIVQPRDGG